MKYVETYNSKVYHISHETGNGWSRTPCGQDFREGVDHFMDKKPAGKKMCKKCKSALGSKFIKNI